MTESIPDWVLEIDGLEHRLHDSGSGEEFTVRVDRPVQLRRGSLTALTGPSGCGKTTLLTILGLLRRPTHPERIKSFRICVHAQGGKEDIIDIKEVWQKGRQDIAEGLRRKHVGFALQSGELLPALTAWENVALPLQLNGISGAACRKRVEELFNAFQLYRPGPTGIRALATSRINKLSGGEYQRIALARAIAHQPVLVFVDEPTAALNRELAWKSLEQLRSVQSGLMMNGAIVMITHDEQLADTFADTIIRMAPSRDHPGGQVVEITRNAKEDIDFSFNADKVAHPDLL